MFEFSQYQATPYLNLLSDDCVESLRSAGHHRSYEDGQFVHSRGDDKPGISIVEDGAAQAGIYSADGSFVLTSYIGPGHTFGDFTVFTNLPRTHDISAVGATKILEVPAPRFLALCADEPAYMQALLKTTLMRSHLLLEMLHALRSLSFLPRVANFLLILAPSEPRSPTLRFRQTDLASTLGVSRASLNTALAKLEKLGLIERGYGQLMITDRGKLVTWLNANAQ